jgi:hypothetical protein
MRAAAVLVNQAFITLLYNPSAFLSDEGPMAAAVRHVDRALLQLSDSSSTETGLFEHVVRFDRNSIIFSAKHVFGALDTGLLDSGTLDHVFVPMHRFVAAYGTPESRLLAEYIWACATRDVRAVVCAWLFGSPPVDGGDGVWSNQDKENFRDALTGLARLYSHKNRAKLASGALHPWPLFEDTALQHFDVFGTLHALAVSRPFNWTAKHILDATESCLAAQHTTPHTPPDAPPYETIETRLRAGARIALCFGRNSA